jgi:uncharacterized membrane protein YraQ (UPF0718 family)
MNIRHELKLLAWGLIAFVLVWIMPVGQADFGQALIQAFALLQWYAREHVLLCLVPAFFIAGVIAVFISQASVVKYFGAGAAKWKSYLIASVSGGILAVCSCTVLPLFAGIHKRGAGLGPAIAFLYSGPAINILAIILTARILGWELGLARVIGAVVFSIVIGISMAVLFRREERERSAQQIQSMVTETRPLWQTALLFFSLVGVLVFANWGMPGGDGGLFAAIWSVKWYITAAFGVVVLFSLLRILHVKALYGALAAAATLAAWLIAPGYPLLPFGVATAALVVVTAYTPGEPREWLLQSWGFTRQIMPLLAAGVLVAGLLLGTGDGGGLIPSTWISTLVGGNSLGANLFASVFGAFMYFATLTEIPIVQGLLVNGMGKGPALALLLAGPALSLPNMLVIRSVLGTKKTMVFVALVVLMSSATGFFFGAIS